MLACDGHVPLYCSTSPDEDERSLPERPTTPAPPGPQQTPSPVVWPRLVLTTVTTTVSVVCLFSPLSLFFVALPGTHPSSRTSHAGLNPLVALCHTPEPNVCYRSIRRPLRRVLSYFPFIPFPVNAIS